MTSSPIATRQLSQDFSVLAINKPLKTQDPSINRKVAFASAASAIGSVASIFLATVLLNSPLLKDISPEDQGTLKSSLTALVTATITLVVGYQVRPGMRDGVNEEDDGNG